jgi:hypothetical protein
MEKYNHYDDQLKSMLEGVLFSPDEKQKELFINNAGKLKSRNQKKRAFWILSSLIALVSTTTVLSLVLLTPKTEVTGMVKNQNDQHIATSINHKNNSELLSAHQVISPSVTNPQTNTPIDQQLKSIIANNEITEQQIETKITTPSNILNYTNVSSPKTESFDTSHSERTETVPATQNENIENIIHIEPFIETILFENKDTLNGPILKVQDPVTNKNETDKKSEYAKMIDDWNIYVSVFYRPEIIFNIIDNDKFIHNAGLEFTFHPFNPRYVVRTGFGISLSQGFYEYQIDYNKYLGSYNKLDSVSFSLASNGFNLIPQYYFSNQDVYNQDLNSYFTKVYRKFIYLQIPLELGYDFYNKESFTMGFRTGPTLSLLMNQQSSQLIIDENKDKIVQINQITPERIAANWQYMVGFNMSKSVRRFIFEIEPRFAYYFNSVYEKGDQTQSPYSFNIRFAIGIK